MSTSQLLVTIKQLHSLEIEISDKLIEKAKSDRDEESILFLVKNNKLNMTANTAVMDGHLEVLKYLHSISKKCTTHTIYLAAYYGHLEVIKYLHEIGKDCTTDAMDVAARNGHLELLKYLRSIGKDCTTRAMSLAAEKGHLGVIKYLHSIGKDCTKDALKFATNNGHQDVVDYLKSITNTEVIDTSINTVPDDILEVVDTSINTTNTSYDVIKLITEARDSKKPIKVFIIQ